MSTENLCRPCQEQRVANHPRDNAPCPGCGGFFCRRHLRQGTSTESKSIGGARLHFTYGHACEALRTARTHCRKGHELAKVGEYVLPGSSKRECRACCDLAKRAFYEREVAQARAAGLPVKVWRKARRAGSVASVR